MSCCGQRRAQARAQSTSQDSVAFEYRGTSWLTIVGAATRRVYWFSERGRRVAVHPADAAALTERTDVIRVGA